MWLHQALHLLRCSDESRALSLLEEEEATLHPAGTRGGRRRALPLPVLTAGPGKAGGPLQLDPSVRPTGWRGERAGRGLGLFSMSTASRKGVLALAAPWPPPQQGAGRAGQRGWGRWFAALSQPSPALWRLGTGRPRVERGPVIQSCPASASWGQQAPGKGCRGGRRAGCRWLAPSPWPSLAAGAVINGQAVPPGPPSARVCGDGCAVRRPARADPGPAGAINGRRARRLGRRDKMRRWAPAGRPLDTAVAV